MKIANLGFLLRLGPAALAVLMLTALARPSHAQILVWPPEPKEPAAEEESPKTLRIDPAPEPEPALRYRFWPVTGQETPGNAMMAFQRAIGMRLEMRANRGPDAFDQNYDQWMSGSNNRPVPLEQLPREAVREYLQANEAVLAEIHRAASMRDAEYDIGLENLSGPDVTTLRLNDFQNARDLGRLLALEIRLALAEKRYDDAIRSIRAGFRLGETVGQASDILIGRLIGFAISGLMLAQVQEMITQPESPNLYWALASLPPSIWEIRRALEYESSLAQRLFPQLADLPREELSDVAWRARLIEATGDYLTMTGNTDTQDQPRVHSMLLAGMIVATFDGGARRYLREIGHSADAVDAMSPSEAVLRATSQHLLRIQDGYTKWAMLPRAIAENYFSGQQLLDSQHVFPVPAGVLVASLRPAIEASQSAGIRTEQTVAFLATVEALRMHAAEYGEFPESLENLQPVPAFRDPATGDHFTFEKISNTEARLERIPVSPGQPDTELRLELRK